MLEAIGYALRIPELRRKILSRLDSSSCSGPGAHRRARRDKAALDKLFNTNASSVCSICFRRRTLELLDHRHGR